MNDLLVVMETIAKDLKELVNALKSTLPQPPIRQPQPPPTSTLTPEEIRRIEDVRMMFPSELGDLLAFEEEEDYIIVKPRQYLGGENFAKIASIVRGA
ncbi:hypothetical protein DRO54_11640, partial [Candidatus Bathyarchaeota archaeon]